MQASSYLKKREWEGWFYSLRKRVRSSKTVQWHRFRQSRFAVAGCGTGQLPARMIRRQAPGNGNFVDLGDQHGTENIRVRVIPTLVEKLAFISVFDLYMSSPCPFSILLGF